MKINSSWGKKTECRQLLGEEVLEQWQCLLSHKLYNNNKFIIT